MANLVNIDTLQTICLYVGEQKIELGSQIEIHCLESTNQIELISAKSSSFKFDILKPKSLFMLAVPANAKAEVVLADQSRITLREHSKLSFPLNFIKPKRKVYLEGEAYMKVAHNANKQFVVETQNMNVSVLGTEFLVSAYPKYEEEAVLLISGKVEVKPIMGDKHILSPNQRYILNKPNSNTNALHQ